MGGEKGINFVMSEDFALICVGWATACITLNSLIWSSVFYAVMVRLTTP